MGRRVSTGVVPGGLGGINVSEAVITTADENKTLTISPNGTGELTVTTNINLTEQNDLRWWDSDTSNWVAFQAPATISSNVTWTLPDADGSNGQLLQTNGSGTLSWATAGVSVSDQTGSASTHYPLLSLNTSGSVTSINTSSTKLSFTPSSGTLSATIFNETSSIALKENLNPIQNALELVEQLQAWTFDRKDGSTSAEPGLIAEEVEKIIPNLVAKDENGNPESISYSRLTAYLIESVKTLSKEIKTLQGKK